MYIGPYIETTSELCMQPVERAMCSNVCCKNRADNVRLDDAFCPKCGSKVVAAHAPTWSPAVGEDSINADSLLNWRTPRDGVVNWTPGAAQRGDGRDFSVDPYVLGAIDLSLAVAREITWFSRTFSSEIEALRLAYGAENVAIKWGVVRWY